MWGTSILLSTHSQVYTKGVAQPIRGTVAATVQIGSLRGVEPDLRTEQIFAGHEVIQVMKIQIDNRVSVLIL